MGILSNIEVSFTDTIAITTTPREVILHSCPSATTVEDIWLAETIGLIVIGGLLIIGYYGCKIVSSVQKAKAEELKSRQSYELNKLDKEGHWKENKDRYDSAWRTIEHSRKESKDCKERQPDSTEDEARTYIKYLWKSGIPANDNVTEKAEQPKS